MTTIEGEILSWSLGRPNWQRNLLKRIVRGEALDDAYIAATAQSVVDGSDVLELPELTLDDIPTTATDGKAARLASVRDLENVNALHRNQVLEFGDTGITVVYGDNGSGKSGYARLIKDAVAARHKEPILPDAFGSGGGEPSATLSYVVDGALVEGKWPAHKDVALAQIHFYDEACGDDYLDRDTELAYRPSVLTVLDALIVQTDAVRDAVGALISESDKASLKAPVVPAGTASAALLENLSVATTQGQIDDLLALEDDAEDVLADLIKESTRLRTTDPSKEKARLSAASRDIGALIEQLESIDALVSPDAADGLVASQAKAKELRDAATAASKTSFADEPLSGVGGATWRAMWEAAEKYSQADPYPEQDFPVTADGSVCVLCQQELRADGQDRLRRFHEFVHNDIAQRAAAAEAAYASARDQVAALTIPTAPVDSAIAFIKSEDKVRGTSLASAITTAGLAQQRILDRLSGDCDDAWISLLDVDIDGLRTLAGGVLARSDAIDDKEFRQTRNDVSTRKDELEGRIALAKIKPLIEAEVNRLKYRASLVKTQGGITTSAVTKVSTELTRKYVTDVVQDHFVRESERMKLEHVILGDKGGSKGRLRHKPSLLGASNGTPKEVLSEGEQTAAGLAGFFTEATFDDTKSALVLDDPMSSLDHERRALAARRIVEFAKDRQVVVFTHDLVFLGELVRHAGELKVATTDRAIERDGARKPGLILDKYPWKAKDADKRIGDLKTDLDRLKKDRASMSPEEYSDATAKWAGRLSQTWERLVRSEVVNKVVDRGTTEVKPKMFRLLAEITAEDNDDFQQGYAASSRWAERHDPSEEIGYMPPEPDEIEQEYERIKAWRVRLKKYGAQS